MSAARVKSEDPVVLRYGSVAEAVAEAARGVKGHNAERLAGYITGQYTWADDMPFAWRGHPHRGMSLAECAEFWATGWPEGLAQMRAAMTKVTVPTAVSVRRRGVWSDQGDTYDRDRLFAGQVDAMWRTTKRVRVQAPTRVRIVADIGGACSLQVTELFWRGAACAALAESLTGAGYGVEIVATAGTTGCPGSLAPIVTVKGFDAPLNIQSLVATTASASFYRTACFALWIGKQGAPADKGLGFAIKIHEQPADHWLRAAVESPDARTLIIPHNCLTAEKANAWVAEQVAALDAGVAA